MAVVLVVVVAVVAMVRVILKPIVDWLSVLFHLCYLSRQTGYKTYEAKEIEISWQETVNIWRASLKNCTMSC
ncbi:hypothetical protein TSAR_016848 [Trichomalopsis sarcophagae]|uniref:Uncharacterized protein n=1 Tax=Trichomalopsis sarcophagae TaxID=543379 RepID=A0A232EHI5_9HYME|nr:hypothetical protein TSAR_016848 [Trichomalopsis sarcophagae]